MSFLPNSYFALISIFCKMPSFWALWKRSFSSLVKKTYNSKWPWNIIHQSHLLIFQHLYPDKNYVYGWFYNIDGSDGWYFKTWPRSMRHYTLPTAEILSGKNVRAWVLMVLYLKKQIKILNKNLGSRLEVAC